LPSDIRLSFVFLSRVRSCDSAGRRYPPTPHSPPPSPPTPPPSLRNVSLFVLLPSPREERRISHQTARKAMPPHPASPYSALLQDEQRVRSLRESPPRVVSLFILTDASVFQPRERPLDTSSSVPDMFLPFSLSLPFSLLHVNSFPSLPAIPVILAADISIFFFEQAREELSFASEVPRKTPLFSICNGEPEFRLPCLFFLPTLFFYLCPCILP